MMHFNVIRYNPKYHKRIGSLNKNATFFLCVTKESNLVDNVWFQLICVALKVLVLPEMSLAI